MPDRPALGEVSSARRDHGPSRRQFLHGRACTYHGRQEAALLGRSTGERWISRSRILGTHKWRRPGALNYEDRGKSAARRPEIRSLALVEASGC